MSLPPFFRSPRHAIIHALSPRNRSADYSSLRLLQRRTRPATRINLFYIISPCQAHASHAFSSTHAGSENLHPISLLLCGCLRIFGFVFLPRSSSPVLLSALSLLSFFFLFLNHDIPLPDLRHIVLRMFLLLPDIKPTHYSMVHFPPFFLQTMIPSSCGFNTYESKSGFSIFSSSLVLALSFLSCGLKFPHFSFLLY